MPKDSASVKVGFKRKTKTEFHLTDSARNVVNFKKGDIFTIVSVGYEFKDLAVITIKHENGNTVQVSELRDIIRRSDPA